MYGRPIMSDELRQVGLMVERITRVTLMFRHLGLKMEEYVCLKVIIMLNPSKRHLLVSLIFISFFTAIVGAPQAPSSGIAFENRLFYVLTIFI